MNNSITRRRIVFSNGYIVSAIHGFGTYSDDGTYEVALLTPKAGVVGEPKGYQTGAELQHLIDKCVARWGEVVSDTTKVSEWSYPS